MNCGKTVVISQGMIGKCGDVITSVRVVCDECQRTDPVRAEFETELAAELARYYPAGAESLVASLKKMRDGDSYADQSVTGAGIAWAAKYAWWAWKQSRACCVVELPSDVGRYLRVNYDDLLADCREAIESAGVKVAQ